MRELQSTELTDVQGGDFGMVLFALYSGLTAGLGFAGLPIAAVGQNAVAIIAGSTVFTVIIALI